MVDFRHEIGHHVDVQSSCHMTDSAFGVGTVTHVYIKVKLSRDLRFRSVSKEAAAA